MLKVQTNTMDPASCKKVRFAKLTTTIVHTTDNKEMQLLWWSHQDIEAFKFQRMKAIHHVQNISKDIANITDATDYMGLELHLSRRIEMECLKHRQEYIRSVIDEQLQCSCPEELSAFARRKSRASIARSHQVGKFYADRSFDENKLLEETLVPSRCL